jgi:hypothetical protein
LCVCVCVCVCVCMCMCECVSVCTYNMYICATMHASGTTSV